MRADVDKAANSRRTPGHKSQAGRRAGQGGVGEVAVRFDGRPEKSFPRGVEGHGGQAADAPLDSRRRGFGQNGYRAVGTGQNGGERPSRRVHGADGNFGESALRKVFGITWRLGHTRRTA